MSTKGFAFRDSKGILEGTPPRDSLFQDVHERLCLQGFQRDIGRDSLGIRFSKMSVKGFAFRDFDGKLEGTP